MSDRVPSPEKKTSWQTYLCDVEKIRKHQDKVRQTAQKTQGLVRKYIMDDAFEPFIMGKTAQKIEPLSKKTRRAIAHGNRPIEAKLDLHGLTQDKAFIALLRFVRRKAEEGLGQVLVITGKGICGTSVLRSNLPFWCTDERLKPFIAALHEAAPNHGGGGAFYLRLRTRKGK